MYSQYTKVIGAGIQGGLQAGFQNDEHNAQLAAYSNLPAAPNYQNLWQQGFNAQNGMTPAQVYSDFKLRSQYAPEEQQQALNLYQQYAPQYNATNMAMLKKTDPQYLSGYKQLGSAVSGDLASGSQLTPQQLQLDNANIAGAQASRGNVLGSANVSAQGLYDANAQNAMYQQRLGNMSNFLQQGGPESKFGQLGGGQGQAALGQGMQGLTQPGTEYYQIPQNLGNTYMQAGQMQWQGNEQNALAKASAAYSAVPQQNPWLASLSAASGAFAGNSGGGGSSGGGSGGSSMMGMFGGGGQNGFSSQQGQSGYNFGNDTGGLGDQASPS